MSRLSYLPFLLPRLRAFFSSSLIDPAIAAHEAWLSFDDVPLKWHYPVGLLYDLHAGLQTEDNGDLEVKADDMLPWKITLHYTNFPAEQLMHMDAEYKVLLDTFINSVKEADFIRNGTARVAMGLSKSDSDTLWHSVQTSMALGKSMFTRPGTNVGSDNLSSFNSINTKLLNPPGASLRHVPIKIYLPSAPPPAEGSEGELEQTGRIRVVQGLVPLLTPSRK